MQITLFSFTKKVNSTKRPTNETTKRIINDVILKSECSIIKPVLRLSYDDSFYITNYNYCYIPLFNRYYFINDYVHIREGIVDIYCDCDLMGSYKPHIGSQECYILRASELANDHIPDGKFPLSGDVVSVTEFPIDPFSGAQKWSNNTPWKSTYSTGTYVIGVINKDSSPGGILSYYAMSTSQFEHFKTIFLGSTSWAVGSFAGFEISEDLWKSLFNPFQYIANCRWYPIDNIVGTNVQNIDIGWWTLPNCPCTKITSLTYDIDAVSFAIPSTGGVPYRLLPPFAEYKLFIPPFGEYDLDGYKVGFRSGGRYPTILVGVRIDLVSGQGALLVTVTPPGGTSADMSILVADTAKIAVDVSFGQINNDILGQIGAGAKIVSSIATINPASIIGGVTGGVIDTLNSIAPSAQKRNGDGTIVIYQSYGWQLEGRFKIQTYRDTDDFGGLVCSRDIISNRNGFIMTANAHIEIPIATKEEINMVQNIMDGGFFYE